MMSLNGETFKGGLMPSIFFCSRAKRPEFQLFPLGSPLQSLQIRQSFTHFLLNADTVGHIQPYWPLGP